MPGKGKGKARGKSRGKSKGKRKSESLQWKVKYRFTARYLRETGQTPAEARIAALKYFEENGEELPGTHIIVSWRNKNNKNPLHANWKTSDDQGQSLGGPKGAFATLHGSMNRALHTPFREVSGTTPPAAPGPGRAARETFETRSNAMKQYHSELRAIAGKHPSWRHDRVRAEYRKKRGRRK
jgi:hypothetical protein